MKIWAVHSRKVGWKSTLFRFASSPAVCIKSRQTFWFLGSSESCPKRFRFGTKMRRELIAYLHLRKYKSRGEVKTMVAVFTFDFRNGTFFEFAKEDRYPRCHRFFRKEIECRKFKKHANLMMIFLKNSLINLHYDPESNQVMVLQVESSRLTKIILFLSRLQSTEWTI